MPPIFTQDLGNIPQAGISDYFNIPTSRNLSYIYLNITEFGSMLNYWFDICHSMNIDHSNQGLRKMKKMIQNLDMRSEDPVIEPISTQAVIHDKKKHADGFTYSLKYTDQDIADRFGKSSVTSEGIELYIDDIVDVYASAQTIQGRRVVFIHQVVGLANGNQQILFDGARDDPEYEDTTTILESSVALVGVEARLNMYEDCGVDPMDM